MARTAITPVKLNPAAPTTVAAGTSADAANGHVVTGVELEELLLLVTHTSAAERDVTIVAGDDPPADAAQELVVPFAAGNVTPVSKILGPFPSARFIQADGSLHIDLETGFTGDIVALRVPEV